MTLLYGNAADSEAITGEENFVPDAAPYLQGTGNYTVSPGVEENLVQQTPIIQGTTQSGIGNPYVMGTSGTGFIDNTPVRGVTDSGGGTPLGVNEGYTPRPYLPPVAAAPNVNISTPAAIPMATHGMPTFAPAQASNVVAPTAQGAALNPIAAVPQGAQLGGSSNAMPAGNFNAAGPAATGGTGGSGSSTYPPFQLSAQVNEGGPPPGAGAQQTSEGQGTPLGLGHGGPVPSGTPASQGGSPPPWMGSFQQAFAPAAQAFHGFMDQLSKDPVGALLGGAESAGNAMTPPAEAANIQPSGGGAGGAPPPPPGTPVAPRPATAQPNGAPASGRGTKLIPPPQGIPLSLADLDKLNQGVLSDGARQATDAQVFGGATQAVKDNVNLARAAANIANQQHFTNAADLNKVLTNTLKQWYNGDPGDPAKGIPPTPAIFQQIHANIFKPLTEQTIHLDQGSPGDPAKGIPPRPPGPAISRLQAKSMLEGHQLHLAQAGADKLDDANGWNHWAKTLAARPMPDYDPDGKVPDYDSHGNFKGMLNEEIRQNLKPEDFEQPRPTPPVSNTIAGRMAHAFHNKQNDRMLREAFPNSDITLTKAWASAKGQAEAARAKKIAEYRGNSDQELKVHKATLDERGAAGGIQDQIRGYQDMIDKANLADNWAKTFLYQQLVLELKTQNLENQDRSLGLKGVMDAMLTDKALQLQDQRNTIQEYLNAGQLGASQDNAAANVYRAQTDRAKEQDAALKEQATDIQKEMAQISNEKGRLTAELNAMTPAKGSSQPEAMARKKAIYQEQSDNDAALIALHKTYENIIGARGKVYTTPTPQELTKKARALAGLKTADANVGPNSGE